MFTPRRSAHHRMRALLPVTLLGLVLPASAPAATITAEAGTLVYRSSSPGSLYVTDSYPAGRLRFDGSETVTSVPETCTQREDAMVDCDIPAAVRVELGSGDDSFGFMSEYTLGVPIEVLGGGGDDRLNGSAELDAREILDGGEGKDRIDGFGGDDEIRGGPGDDMLEGNGGADSVLGEDGNDTLAGDDQAAPGKDLIDGGPGSDTLKDYVEFGTDVHPPADVSLNGLADDGRAGEGDDVRSIERMTAYVSGRFVLSDGAEDWQVWANMNSGRSVVLAGGGDDRVVAEDAVEEIDGGPGDDYLEGGKNHDVLTGGPGRDLIYGDDTDGSCNENYVESCVLYGNDEIHARDGETDQVDCGAGTDRVTADAADVVAPNCETVERGTAPEEEPGVEKPPVNGGSSLALIGRPKLRTALRKGFKVRLTGAKAGRAKLVAVKGGRRMATGTVVVAADGTATAKLRFSKSAARKLRQAKSVKLAITGAGVAGKVTLRR